jgi:hypothetical protein
MKPEICIRQNPKSGKRCFCCHRINPEPKGRRDAEKEAKKAFSRLRNPKLWRISLWHNINWCWCLEAADGFLALYPVDGEGGAGRLSAMLTLGSWRHACDVRWTDGFCRRDPNAVVKHALERARRVLLNESNRLEEIAASVGYTTWILNSSKTASS